MLPLFASTWDESPLPTLMVVGSLLASMVIPYAFQRGTSENWLIDGIPEPLFTECFQKALAQSNLCPESTMTTLRLSPSCTIRVSWSVFQGRGLGLIQWEPQEEARRHGILRQRFQEVLDTHQRPVSYRSVGTNLLGGLAMALVFTFMWVPGCLG